MAKVLGVSANMGVTDPQDMGKERSNEIKICSYSELLEYRTIH